jgi:histidine triad (HIT) family protein
MDACPICAKHKGSVVGDPLYQDDLVYAHHAYEDQGESYLGYLRVETQRHVPSFAELTAAEAQAVGLLVTRLSRALKDCAGADHVYVYYYGDRTPHLHVLLFARYPGTPEEYWRDRLYEWSGSPKGGAAEVAVLSDRLRSSMESAAA